MADFICWTEFMQPWEAAQFREAMVISSDELDLLAWVREEREGRPVYRTDIYQREVTVWREENGKLARESIYYQWIAEDQIDQLYALLKARGFSGTRTDETTPTRHIVIFQQGKERLVIRAAQHEYQTLTSLSVKADVFLANCR